MDSFWCREAICSYGTYEDLGPNHAIYGAGSGPPGGRPTRPIISIQSGTAISRPSPPIGRQWATDVARAVPREKSPPAHLCFVVSRLPRARARVARSDQGTLEERQAASAGNSRRAAPRPRAPLHAMEADGLATDGGLPESPRNTSGACYALHRRVWHYSLGGSVA